MKKSKLLHTEFLGYNFIYVNNFNSDLRNLNYIKQK